MSWKEKKLKKPKDVKLNKLAVLAVVGCFVGIFGIFSLLVNYPNILPGTFLGNVDLGNQNVNAGSKYIRILLDSYQVSKISLDLNGNKKEASLGDLGVLIDEDFTVDRLQEDTLSLPFASKLARIFASPFGKYYVPVSYRVDIDKLESFLKLYFGDSDTEASDPTISLVGTPSIKDGVDGLVIDRAQLIADLKSRVGGLSNEDIVLLQVKSEPFFKTEHAKKALERVSRLSGQGINLYFGDDSWKLSGQDLLKMTKFLPLGQESQHFLNVNFGNIGIAIKSLDYKDKAEPVLNVTLNKNEADKLIEGIADRLDRPTVDATLKFDGVRVSEFTPAVDGQLLDRDQTAEMVAGVFSVDNLTFDKQISLKLPVKVSVAKVANEQINSLGIRELIGKGVSYYAGSIANRAYNVSLGASRLNGKLLAPGEIFSFNSTVGEVSGKTGYRQAYVISEGRTVLDDGGGICQVSTTVFRAALNSGMPIITRTAHAYRVGYYEQNGVRPGLDATVWSPAVDLQFKNDTEHHILLQAIVDPSIYRLEIDLYGTSDGRKVEITDPVLTNQSPAPPDKFQDDPTLPKGTVKQVDFAAPGATSTFYRKVTKSGVVILDNTFRSVYRPWQAIFLKGIM